MDRTLKKNTLETNLVKMLDYHKVYMDIYMDTVDCIPSTKVYKKLEFKKLLKISKCKHIMVLCS